VKVDAPPARRRAVGIAGPTASGKSAAAMALAAHLPIEIVSVDSAQVYRGMDIGTAKPSAEERAAVAHHLVDLIEPTQAYSAAQFVADANRLIGEINGRGAAAVLVGGTMLYFKALLEGLDEMPPADAAVRAELDARALALGWPAMHAELAEVDPITAARLPPNDSQRVQRALEVWRITGRPLSSFHRKAASAAASSAACGDDAATMSAAPAVAAPHLARPDLPLISLEPTDRAWLHRRVEQRFAAMLDDGLVDEVRRLRARGDLNPDLPSMRCVGYRQTWAMLDEAALRSRRGRSPAGIATPLGTDEPGASDIGTPDLTANDLALVAERGVAATRQLAKRQLTWLRGMPTRTVVACDRPDALATTIGQALRLLA
jgi:tRNA dimethylallyltransferase